MNKEELTRRVIEILTRAGFTLSERCNIRPRSFDLAARRQDILLLLRVFSNVDGLNAPTALAMKHLSGCLNGSPLVIGSRSRNQVLEDGVAYFRHGIPSISPTTLYDCFVEGVPPLVYAAPGGLYVGIDGEHLKNIRIARNISLGELATELGISRRTISKYEEEEMDASVDVVLRLEEVLNSGFVCPIRIFSTGRDSTGQDRATVTASGQSEPGEVSLLLTPLGFVVVPAKQAPFAAVSDDGVCNTVLTGISGYNRTMAKNAHLMSSISVVAGTKSLYIVKGGCKHTHIDDTVLIKESEFKKIDDHDDVMQLIQERSIDRGDIT
jgi:putative transcriptional regulator